MPKLVRSKPGPEPLAQAAWEADLPTSKLISKGNLKSASLVPEGQGTGSIERDSVVLQTLSNGVRSELEVDRTTFDGPTEPKLVRTKPPELVVPSGPEAEAFQEAINEAIEQASVESVTVSNDLGQSATLDRTAFDASTDSAERGSVEELVEVAVEALAEVEDAVKTTIPLKTEARGTKAVLKAPVREEERRPFDDYPTEPGWTHALLNSEEFPGLTLEPAAGAGWMVQTLQERGLDVVYSDLERDGLDFLADDYVEFHGHRFQNVITNPPYKYLDAFAQKALELADRKVALLLPDFALVGVNRTKDLWQAHPPKKLIMVTSKMKVLGKVSMFPHVWAVWDKQYEGPTTWEWATVPRELRLDTSKAEPNLRSKK